MSYQQTVPLRGIYDNQCRIPGARDRAPVLCLSLPSIQSRSQQSDALRSSRFTCIDHSNNYAEIQPRIRLEKHLPNRSPRQKLLQPRRNLRSLQADTVY